jgi:flagellar hook-basal body complex protein FliE
MTIPASAAIQAYTATRSAAPTAKSAPTAAVTPEAGFGDLLKEAMDSVTSTGKVADETALAQAAGKADMIDVVTAVTETELAVQTLVSVRDRVISAYQEVMRMPI